MSPTSEDGPRTTAQDLNLTQPITRLRRLRAVLRKAASKTDVLAADLISQLKGMETTLTAYLIAGVAPRETVDRAEALIEAASQHLEMLGWRQEDGLVVEVQGQDRMTDENGEPDSGLLDLVPDLASPERLRHLVKRHQAGAASLAENRFANAVVHAQIEGGPGAKSVVALYLDNDEDYFGVREALEAALDVFGLEVDHEFPPVRGSIWQAFVAAFKRETTPEGVDGAVGVARAGAEARWYGEPQSQITKAQAEAIAAILQSLEGTDNALLHFSNMLILKIDGVPLVRELSPEQVERLTKNPGLFTDPRRALQALDEGEWAAQRAGGEPGQQAITS
ncbi:hypothetical protein ACIBQX_28085 [Nonomuraea sp. NPDC049714]|uniref:hypothetical protein n=1 Tax=Nonomuraea sp. NPDC049714 TaxID=3364357 RepID=UPI0037B9A93E